MRGAPPQRALRACLAAARVLLFAADGGPPISTKVLLDLRCLETASAVRGFGRYARELARALGRELPAGWALLGLCGSGETLVEGVAPVRYRGPRRGIGYADRLLLPPLFRRLGVDLYHSPAYPLPGPGDGARPALVLTVHDLVADLRPEAVPLRHRLAFRRTFRSARVAHRVIAVSSATRRELLARYGVPEDRVAVVPNGVAEAFQTPREGKADSGLPRPYLLYVGGLDPLKNVAFLVDVLEGLRGRGEPARLVVIGAEEARRKALAERAAAGGVGDGVVFAGTVDDEALAAAYRDAEALLYPSLYEGFGLPPLEAMAAGCPVVSSPAGALAENLEGAAILLEPSDPARWVEAIVSLRRSPDLRERLVSRGRQRARSFTWQRTARATLGVYREALEERARA